jgi:hypothetical protein
MSNFPEINNLEISKLKKRVAELEIELTKAQEVLKDNDLFDEVLKISDTEAICTNEISKLKIASDNGILTLEDVKILDLLVKNLLAIKGKTPTENKESKKKGQKTVAELLSIVNGNKI